MNVVTDISLNNEWGIVILEDSKAAHDDFLRSVFEMEIFVEHDRRLKVAYW